MGAKDAKIVGEALAAVLPHHDKPWYRVSYLLRLNLLLLIPLMSSAIAGYDGKPPLSLTLNPNPVPTNDPNTFFRLHDERSPSPPFLETRLQQSKRARPRRRQRRPIRRLHRHVPVLRVVVG